MSKHLFYAITPNKKRLTSTILPAFITVLALFLLSACTPVIQEPVVIEPPKNEESIKPTYNSDPIIPAEIIDVRFAQQALKKIGYKIGSVDGLWGPRSASAIREFETEQDIVSANGHLSELNLHELEVVSGILRANYGKITILSPTGISAKLDPKVALSAGPQLIIVDREYTMYSKPNPYSSELLTLAPGTGIYVISKQDGYFRIESINRKRGYIKID